ncbi:MAG: ATP-binding protein [Draconibacterium sp.]
MPEQKIDTLKFRFDVSAYRLIGRELITDRITALFELVKNCYDANAENVLVQFENVNPKTEKSKIIIKDDGVGMSFEDLRDKWMVIGTSSKRRNLHSPEPYNRKVVGKKGIGRFAVDKLGSKLVLKTKKKDSNKTLCLETDWSSYEKLEGKQLKLDFDGNQTFFTDVENKYWFEDTPDDSHGTSLEITIVGDVWTEKDIIRAYKELSKLISPEFKPKYPFRIRLNAPEYKEYINKTIESQVIEFATLDFDLGFDLESNTQEILKVEKGQLVKISVPSRPCGLVRLKLYYYDQKAKNKFRTASPEDRIDGIKVYRDGLIATPFAEYEEEISKQKDLFGIDKRRWSGFFDKLSTRDLLGWVEISEERNPLIIDATNRQDFVDNEAWKELKDFVIEQISKIEDYLKVKKKDENLKTQSTFAEAKDDLSQIRKELNKAITFSNPEEVKATIEKVEKQIAKAQASVNKSFNDYKELEKEKKQQENLFFSLVSLQTYAGMLSHITRTSLGRIKRRAEFIHKWIPEPKFNQNFKEYGEGIFKEMNQLDSAIDFLLKYAKDDEYFEEINVKETIRRIFNDIYDTEFKIRGVKSIVEINKELTITYNPKSFEDIFDNLISNSFKALANNEGEKLIKCSAIVEKDKFVIYFSDNGYGIKEKDKYRIFDVFFTTTAEQGGAGLGLFIVKSRIEALKGSIEVVENELKPTGATFKIELPFRK